jgi:hypothetical protein
MNPEWGGYEFYSRSLLPIPPATDVTNLVEGTEWFLAHYNAAREEGFTRSEAMTYANEEVCGG